MPRIKCKTPSTGRPVNLVIADLGTTWQTLAEAPDFSIPDTGNVFADRDPLDVNRAIRSGEVFFMTPMFARNKSTQDLWVEIQLVQESGVTIECPGKIIIPAGDTAFIPLQGRSIVKRVATNQFGDRIQVRAQTVAAIDVWAGAEEKPSTEHIGVVE